jgi:hypothetical protein
MKIYRELARSFATGKTTWRSPVSSTRRHLDDGGDPTSAWLLSR